MPDTFFAPMNLGPEVNSIGKETSPYVTRDGAYLFFASDRGFFDRDGFFNRPRSVGDGQMTYEDFVALSDAPGNGRQDIYWIDASFLEDLRNQVVVPAEPTNQ